MNSLIKVCLRQSHQRLGFLELLHQFFTLRLQLTADDIVPLGDHIDTGLNKGV